MLNWVFWHLVWLVVLVSFLGSSLGFLFFHIQSLPALNCHISLNFTGQPVSSHNKYCPKTK